jgi:hypothetical protein
MGFNPLNRPTYKLITKKAKELQRHVVELLDSRAINQIKVK